MRREIFPWCMANGIGVMAYGSLAYGLLTGVTLIIVGLTYFPVLALGPIAEHFMH